MEAGAENRVEKEFTVRENLFQLPAREIGLMADIDGRQRQLIEHRLGIPADFCGLSQDHNRNFTARFSKTPGGDQPIASIVAFAAKNTDTPALGQFSKNKAGNRPSRMLHQLEERSGKA